MALISCPNCGKEISDKAYQCPKCGYVLNKQSPRTCSECGAVVPEGASCCPNCGAPVQNFTDTTKFSDSSYENSMSQPQKKRKTGWVIAIILIAIVCGIGYYFYSDSVRTDTYNKFVNLYNTMVQGAARAEEANNLIHDVWANCIWQKEDVSTDKYTRKDSGNGDFYDDFNDALNSLYEDEGFIEKVQEVYNYQTEATSILRDLGNLPRPFLEEYSDFKNCYNLFLKFTNMSISPEGSLSSFTDNHNSLDREIADKLNELQIYFE